MSCENAIYQTKTISEDLSAGVALQERHEILDYKSSTLGELLISATEAPNGYTTTACPERVLEALKEYLASDELDTDDKKYINKCIEKLKDIIKADKDTVSVNVWY